MDEIEFIRLGSPGGVHVDDNLQKALSGKVKQSSYGPNCLYSIQSRL
jgi:hypothetical protein